MTNSPIKTADYFRLAREAEASWVATTPILAVLATFSAELMRPFFIVEAENYGMPFRPWFGPFQQLEQMVLNDNSELWRKEPSVIWIALRLEDVHAGLVHDAASLSLGEVEIQLSSICSRLVNLVQSARQRFAGPILVSNFSVPWMSMMHWFDASDPNGITHLISGANRHLARELQAIPDAHVFDYERIVSEAGAAKWTDPKLWYLARSATSADNQSILARAIARAAIGVTRPSAKCIVIDLDNTIWGGVIGDDGLEGVQLGDDYPGNVFKDFQAALLGYRRRGTLLAVASKNDEQTVLEMFDKHPEMVLKREHFAALQINWEPKSSNLRRIAETLNIGLDSLVFVDDNPVERAEVKSALPMIHIVDLPASPLGFLAALKEMQILDRPRLLAEDRQRAEMYQADSGRRHMEKVSTTVDEYLIALEMVAEVGLCDATSIDRIHQLIQKTNQFNLTTRRHSLETIRQLAMAPACRVAWLRLRDQYGDLGLVCVGLIRQDPAQEEVWEIDTLLMSCRVMGRRVEDAFLAFLAELVREAGGSRLRGVYIPTLKNTPVKSFYSDRKFTPVATEQPHELWFEADLTSSNFAWPDVITAERRLATTHD